MNMLKLVCDCNPKKIRERRYDSLSDYRCPICDKQMKVYKSLRMLHRAEIARRDLIKCAS